MRDFMEIILPLYTRITTVLPSGGILAINHGDILKYACNVLQPTLAGLKHLSEG